VWADAPGDGRPRLSTNALAALPAGVPVAVEPRDDTDANLRLRDVIAARLRDQHHPVVADALYRLRFSTETISDVGPGPGAAASDAVAAHDVQPYAENNLNYSEADRFFNPNNDRASRGDIRMSFQVRASLERRDTGEVIWIGQTNAPLAERDERRLATELADTLADAIGRTVDTASGKNEAAPASATTPAIAAATAAHPVPAYGALRLPWSPVSSLPELAERR
jgi:hypothetical protein